MTRMPLRRFVIANALPRNVNAGDLLEHFLVAAAAAVLGIRLYLAATGYPQVGGGGLHIAHMLWGGVLMLSALVMMLTFLGPRVRARAAIIGGVGFGTFIDELGKFITSDNNYFFRPTVALIYAIFILLFLIFQALARRDAFSPRAALSSALDAIEEAVARGFTAADRDYVLGLLDRSERDNPLVLALRQELLRVVPAPASSQSLPIRVAATIQRFYLRVIREPWFLKLVITLFVLEAVVTVLGLGIEIVKDPAFSTRNLNLSLVDELRTVASGLADGMILVGVLALRWSRLAAYIWFKRSLLVSLFLVQFFWFYADDLAAAGWLALSLVLLAVLDFAIQGERAAAGTVAGILLPTAAAV